MTNVTRYLAGALILLLPSTEAFAVSDVAPRTFVTPAEKLIDTRAEVQILTGFNLNPQLRNLELSVAVDGGTATLAGTVEDDVSKELAGDIARAADNVRRVENRIAVDPRTVPRQRAAGSRSFGEVVDDATIVAKIKSKLLWSSRTDGLDLHVDVRGGRVILSGLVASVDERTAAERLARTTNGVNMLINHIGVAKSARPQRSAADPEQKSRHVSDVWITTKVRSSLMFTRGTNVFAISVATHDGVVSLSGIVLSESERKLVIDVATGVRGVKNVTVAGLKVA